MTVLGNLSAALSERECDAVKGRPASNPAVPSRSESERMIRGTGDEVRLIEPIVKRRECGGWIAISGRDAPINFAVVAETEEEVRENFSASREAWAKLRDLP